MTNKILPRFFILISKNLHGCSGQKGKCYLIRIAAGNNYRLHKPVSDWPKT